MPSFATNFKYAVFQVQRTGIGTLSVYGSSNPASGSLVISETFATDIACGNHPDSQSLAETVVGSINGTSGWGDTAFWFLDADEYVYVAVRLVSGTQSIHCSWNNGCEVTDL